MGVQRSCQVFSARLLCWPRCSPLNETWLTAMSPGSTKLKLPVLCCTPRETDFSCRLLCWRRAEKKSHTIAHDGGAALLLASVTRWKNHLKPGCLGCSSATFTMLQQYQQKSKLLPYLNPGQQRVTSLAPYRDKGQEPQLSRRAS